MRKILLLLLVILLIFAVSCRNASPQTDETTEMVIIDLQFAQAQGQAYIEKLFSGQFEEALKNHPHDQAMVKAVDADKYNTLFFQLYQQYGEFIKFSGSDVSEKGEYLIYSVGVIFEKESLNANVVFNQAGEISGMNFGVFTFDDTPTPIGIKEIDITFGLSEWKLAGKITLPDKEGKYPLLILVHGSGANNMNETVGLNEPFMNIADFLPTKNIAVLRYDKRTFTYGPEMADLKTLTVYDETIDDVKEAIAFAQTLEYIDKDNIWILGHSLGAYLIPRIAEETPEAKGYVMAAGMFSTLAELVPYQTEYLAQLDGTITPEDQNMIDDMIEQSYKINNPSLIEDDEIVLGAYKAYWEDLYAYDPATLAKNISKPVLVIQGERDYQVPSSEYYEIYEEMKDYPNYTFKLYLGVNHLLMHGEGVPSPEEYYVKGEVYPPLLDDIATFILE
ncbi:MAG: alpha/beta fold hydrolase [Tissierellales bacterium]|nr:alpha/beta fold hydrolase [Tissierellales bacterium]MBN2827564.1 alpha/beta fold hydrolase [Tissierellales bacterium]